MIGFDIHHRHIGAVLFAAEIDCTTDAPRGQKFRLAVLQASRADADLRKADLVGADLHGADLHGADLRGADLHGANLRKADLRGANLHRSDLGGTDLGGANLRKADLRGADLHGADLRGADLRGADLHGANLRGADLRGANLHDIHGYLVGPQRPDGYRFDLRSVDSKWCVVAGCRTLNNWTTEQYREHAGGYDDPQKQAETLAILDYLDARAVRVAEVVRDEAAEARDYLADAIGASPMSSIHNALSEYRNCIRAIDPRALLEQMKEKE